MVTFTCCGEEVTYFGELGPGQVLSCSWCGKVHAEGEEPPGLPVDIVAEPHVAYRAWRISSPQSIALSAQNIDMMEELWIEEGISPFSILRSPWLRALARPDLWGKPMSVSVCTTHGSKPHRDCMCGLWGLHDLETLKKRVMSYPRGDRVAYGTVQMWGTVIEHELGFRAEFAKPYEITVFGVTSDEAQAMAEAYDCKVELGSSPPFDRSLEALNAEWGKNFLKLASAGNASFAAIESLKKKIEAVVLEEKKALEKRALEDRP